MSSSTPVVSRVSHANTISNVLLDRKAIKQEREADAKLIVKHDLIPDVDGVFESAQPLDKDKRQLATETAQFVCEELEKFIGAAESAGAPSAGASSAGASSAAHVAESVQHLGLSDTEPSPFSGPVTRSQTRRLEQQRVSRQQQVAAPGQAALMEFQPHVLFPQPPADASPPTAPQPAGSTDTYIDLVDWVTMTMPGSAVKVERDMYPGINAFVKFVADSVSRHMEKHGNNSKARSIVPFEKTDVNPEGADDGTRIDHMLTGCLFDGAAVDPDYAKALCLIEAKYSSKDQKDAYAQLVMYSRNIYGSQPHRRFLWGLTVCGTLVRACLLMNDKIYASEAVDAASPEGRGRFVGLLVNWSLCESTRAGYDPTMECDEGGRWTIKVFKDRIPHVYGGLEKVFDSYSLFGRHTRCFVGKTKVNGDEKEVLIKDCWPRVLKDSAGRPRDEVAFLTDIRDTLGADTSLDHKYPELEMACIVQVPGRGPADVDDTTTEAFADLDLPDSAPPDSAPPDSAPPDSAPLDPLPLRKHKRIIMSPVGAPLQTVNSPDELIVAVCDAMEVHTEIVRRCGILHRDISINNILVRRTGDMVGGMLIDFDNAIRLDVKHSPGQSDRTGNLPYMCWKSAISSLT